MTTTTKKVVKKPTKKAKITEANKAATVQKVVVKRELKYQYPKGMVDTLARKSYRQKVRNTIRKMSRQIAKLKGEEKAALKQELEAYQAKHLVNA